MNGFYEAVKCKRPTQFSKSFSFIGSPHILVCTTGSAAKLLAVLNPVLFVQRFK